MMVGVCRKQGPLLSPYMSENDTQMTASCKDGIWSDTHTCCINDAWRRPPPPPPALPLPTARAVCRR